MNLPRTLLEHIGNQPGRITYGTATNPNTVAIAEANTAVTLPALTPVTTGDYCAIWERGADRLILGPVGRGWTSFTPAWTNFTPGNATQHCRYMYTDAGMRVKCRILLGSTSVVGASVVRMTIPDGRTALNLNGSYDVGSGYYVGPNGSLTPIVGNASTTIDLYESGGITAITTNNPITWTVGDAWVFDIDISL